QGSFMDKLATNQINTLVSGEKNNTSLYIHQDAKIAMAYCDKDINLKYPLAKNNGLFVMTIAGQIEIAGHKLKNRDAIALSETKEAEISAQANSKILFIEVALNE